LLSNPPANAQVLSAGRFQVLEILLEGSLIELGEKLGLNAYVEASDIIDELTFIHGRH
jgi:hypothetical protein